LEHYITQLMSPNYSEETIEKSERSGAALRL
jgi:hypothetical protein